MTRTVRMVALFAIVIASLGFAPASGKPTAAGIAKVRSPLEVDVVTPPSPVAGTDKRRHLVYEITMVNTANTRVRLDRLVVRDVRRNRSIESWTGAAIKSFMFGIDAGGPSPTRTLEPDQLGVLLLDVRLRSGEKTPKRLGHRFELSLLRDGGQRNRVTMTGAATGVKRSAPITASPPLVTDNLGVFGCCAAPFAHRLALLGFGNRIVVAQRYAIDFVQLDDDLNTFAGDPTLNESYYIYGEQVIAVAAGEVVATRNDMAENTPPGAPPDVPLNDLAGNFVVQEVGPSRFALYAHLQPGSVAVEPGDVVQPGQVIGLVGNTGNSTEPHLHFHVMNGPGGASTLEADGRPYVFDSFNLDWVITGLDENPPAPVREPASPPRERTNQLPLTGAVISVGGPPRTLTTDSEQKPAP
jgi:Peptidase family M23